MGELKTSGQRQVAGAVGFFAQFILEVPFLGRRAIVIPWVQVDTGPVPGSPETLRLMQRGDEFSIRVGTVELMNSRRSGSEAALATLTCARLRDRPQARALIGGLGMGFTLRA